MEVPFSPIHGEQPSDHLPGYRERRSIGIPLLLWQGRTTPLASRCRAVCIPIK